MNSDKADGEVKDGEFEENKKKSVDGRKGGSTQKKLTKGKVVPATRKVSRPESSTTSGQSRVKPELTLPIICAMEWMKMLLVPMLNSYLPQLMPLLLVMLLFCLLVFV